MGFIKQEIRKHWYLENNSGHHLFNNLHNQCKLNALLFEKKPFYETSFGIYFSGFLAYLSSGNVLPETLCLYVKHLK